MSLNADALLKDLRSRLGHGIDNATPAKILSIDLGVSERTVRQLVGELIDRGELIGSNSQGELSGYFLIEDWADLDIGTRHLVSRARSMFARVSKLRRAAEAHFGSQALTLFDLEEEVPV